MKKIQVWLYLLILFVLFTSCGNADVPRTLESQTVSETDTSSRSDAATSDSAETNKTSSAFGTIPETLIIQIGEDEAQRENIPIYVYDEDNGEGSYIYVNRLALIDYIDSNHPEGYFPLAALKDSMAFPNFYIGAGHFDKNGHAVVQLKTEHETRREQILWLIINANGEPVTDTEKTYEYIESIDNYYLCYYRESPEEPQSVDILDGKATVVKTLSGAGIALQDPQLPHILIFPERTMHFDLHSMSDIKELPEVTQNAMYSTMASLGNGYFAVSDASDYDENLRLMWQYLQQDTYKKAIYKDGVLLTDYRFFIINPVKDSVFFVYDGKEYYFFDAKRNDRIFHSLTDRCVGNFNFFYHPGLLIGENMGETVYLTNQSVAKNHEIFPLNETASYYYLHKNPNPSYLLYPHILLNDKETENRINRAVSEEAELYTPAAPENPNPIISSIDNNMMVPDIFGNLLQIRQTLHSYNVEINSSNFVELYHYYDLKTGQKMTLDDWFQDKDMAIALLIASANFAYREAHPESEIPEDQETFFGTELWEKWILFNEYGFRISIPMYWETGHLEFTVSDEDLQLFLKPELYELLHSENQPQ